MEQQLDVRERLEPGTEPRLRPPDPLRDSADAAAVGRVDVEHSIGLAKILRNERGYRTAFFSGGDPDWDGMYWAAHGAGMAEVFGPK